MTRLFLSRHVFVSMLLAAGLMLLVRERKYGVTKYRKIKMNLHNKIYHLLEVLRLL